MTPSADHDLHHIVVVGGGAGGLELATRLGDRLARKGKIRVTLIERARSHLWKPLLHEIAAGSMDASQHEVDYLAHAYWHSFRFRFGEMIGLDRAKREVHLAATFDDDGEEITPPRSFSYDTLVIAVGSTTNDFGTPGVRQHAISLETPEQAVHFNRRIVNACFRAHTQAAAIRPDQLHVTIVGAGATGAELSAELHHTTRAVVAYGLDKIDPSKDIRITLVEGAGRILPALPERVANSTASLLEELGVEIKTNAKVISVSAEGVHLASGETLKSSLVVWAAGVKGPDLLRDLDGLESTRNNQLVVMPTLQTTNDPDIFAMGDCASCPQPGSDHPVPPRAQAAHQQASHIFGQIKRRLATKPLTPYVYKDFGSLVSLGQYSTVGSLMGFAVGKNMLIEGYFALLMYRALYKMHQIALHGGAKVCLDTLGRLITRRTLPHVKLH
nr:NAD(P)/FAD-dependent oxidoreductase [Methylocella silvestris]